MQRRVDLPNVERPHLPGPGLELLSELQAVLWPFAQQRQQRVTYAHEAPTSQGEYWVFYLVLQATSSGAVHDMSAARRDLIVGGPNLAAQAFKAGLVDECRLFLWPVIIGGGKPALPSGNRGDLELLDERRFGNGVVHLRYRIPT